jgi:predicted metal-dependent hydrolase
MEFLLRRSARKTLAISVEPGGDVVVTAPEAATLEQVEAVVQRRREWIRRRRREVEFLPPPPIPRQWVSGETHRYLGRQYRLRVIKTDRPEVKLAGGFFRVGVPAPAETEQVRKWMQRWYLDHARSIFMRQMTALVRQTPRLELEEAPQLLVRKLQMRWGSCSPERRILMNVDVVKLPVGCIDYLLMHELCHLRIPHHGPEFWRLLAACMPDWERWRSRLDTAEI